MPEYWKSKAKESFGRSVRVVDLGAKEQTCRCEVNIGGSCCQCGLVLPRHHTVQCGWELLVRDSVEQQQTDQYTNQFHQTLIHSSVNTRTTWSKLDHFNLIPLIYCTCHHQKWWCARVYYSPQSLSLFYIFILSCHSVLGHCHKVLERLKANFFELDWFWLLLGEVNTCTRIFRNCLCKKLNQSHSWKRNPTLGFCWSS